MIDQISTRPSEQLADERAGHCALSKTATPQAQAVPKLHVTMAFPS